MLVVPVTAGLDDAVIVYPTPVLLILRPENVATPLTTATAPPPVRTPPPGFAPMARVIVVELSVTTVLFAASLTATVTDGAIAAPAAVLPGC